MVSFLSIITIIKKEYENTYAQKTHIHVHIYLATRIFLTTTVKNLSVMKCSRFDNNPIIQYLIALHNLYLFAVAITYTTDSHTYATARVSLLGSLHGCDSHSIAVLTFMLLPPCGIVIEISKLRLSPICLTNEFFSQYRV